MYVIIICTNWGSKLNGFIMFYMWYHVFLGLKLWSNQYYTQDWLYWLYIVKYISIIYWLYIVKYTI